MKLSAAIIVKNESVLLARCLKSLEGIDEIVIVDTGSIDNTIEVAKQFTDKIFEFTWVDDFSKARNYAIEQTTGDWIISIDADEVLEDGGIEAIRQAISQTKIGTIMLRLVAEYGTDHLHNVRVFNSKQRFAGAIHETVAPLHDSLVIDTKITYGSSPAHELDPLRNIRILTSESKVNPNGRNLYYLAREFFYQNDYANAILSWEKCLELSQWMPERADAYLMLAKCYWNTAQGDKARDRCMNAILINPEFKEAINFMGDIVWSHYSARWKLFSETANNNDVLFIRGVPLSADKICLYRNGGLGDVCMMLGAAKAIRKNRNVRITVCTSPNFHDLVKACPWVDEVVTTLPIGMKIYDWNSASYGTAPKHQIDAYLDDLGIIASSEDKEIDIQEVESVILNMDEGSPLIAVHAGLSDPNRTWPLDNWIKLLESMKDYRVILIGSDTEVAKRYTQDIPKMAHVHNFVNQTSLVQTAWILKRCKMLVSADSGPIQLAGAARCPVVGIYSVVPGSRRMPYGIKNRIIEPTCPSFPCYDGMKDSKVWADNSLGKTFSRTFSEWCLQKERYACMMQMSPELVLEKIKELMGEL